MVTARPCSSVLVRARPLLAAVGLVANGGCGEMRDMFSAHADVAASAGARRLPAERIADLFVHSRGLAVQSDVMTRFTHLWVDYVLFADRALAGDSLLDSASVLSANWPTVHQLVLGRFHDQLVRQRLTLDSARLDSVYAAGDLRFIRHVLIRTDTSMSAAQRDAKHRQAERIRSALAAGTPWERANQANEDPDAKAQGGSLGVIARGETVQPFDAAAFGLAPGELGPVTASPFGFHVIRRPQLAEVRNLYRAGIQQRLVARIDSVYLAELPGRRHFQVGTGASAAVREVARDPVGARQSHRVLASFDGGRFTAGDLARWLDVLPGRTAEQIPRASDDELKRFVETVGRNLMLFQEAQAAGVTLTADEFAQLRQRLGSQLGDLRRALGLDSLGTTDTTGAPARSQLVGRKVDAYLERIAADPQALVPLPPPLADRLRERAGWRVYPAGVQRAFDLARVRRASLDSAAGRTAPEDAAGGARPR